MALARFIVIPLLLAVVAPAFAGHVPVALGVSGELTNPDGSPVTQSSVNFRFKVYDAANSCVLYTEEHLGSDLSQTKGRFALVLGQGTSIANNVAGSLALDATVFQNAGATSVAGCASAVALNPGDARQLHVEYDLGSGWTQLNPPVAIVASAYALQAETLAGLSAEQFLQVASNGSTSLSQSNANYAFSAVNWPRLKALLDGVSSQYLPASGTSPIDFNNQRLTDVHDPTAPQDAATKHYVDGNFGGSALDLTGVGPATGGGSTVVWDSVAAKWVVGTPSISGTAGGDLTGSYPNPSVANNAITAAKINTSGGGVNRILITDSTTGNTVGFGVCAIGEVYAWTATGFACTSASSLAPVQSVAGKTGAVTLNAGDIGGLGTAALYDWGSAANQIPRLDGSGRLPAVDGSQLVNVNATLLQTRAVAAVAPTTGQVLTWNGSAWSPASAAGGTVAMVGSGTGLVGGPITSSGTLSVDVGVTANKILQLNASAQIPAVDGSLLTNVNAVTLQSRALASTAPLGGQVISWNASASQWQPSSVTSGTVTNVASGTGLVGGPITTNGTLSVDVGVTANKILQLNASAQLPAVDGSLLTNVNAVSIQSRAVAATAPLGGQVIAWNASLSQWQPSSVTSGTVTNIASGNGLLGGPISSNGTLSVDAGTAANKILQLNASAQIPAVDGSLLTNVNAVSLQMRPLAATLPTAGQVIAWNASLAQWQPSSVTSGTVTTIASGTGLLGGPISSNGTLSVDVGTAANKILQLNASAQIPAVDGSLLTNVNAISIQSRPVASTAPVGGQVIAWNASLSQWQPSSVTSGTVTNVASGNGLLGGPISSNGTLSVDTGTTAGKILQLNASAQIPAVDGSLLTNVNAVSLQSRSLAATAPTSGQVIAWNASASQWQPSSVTSGTVTNIASGTGLLGGPISSNGTLSVDVGTAANKILQLNASAQIPAVDGSLLTNVNAVSIQSRAVSATAPTSGQVIAWNTTASQWQPSSVTSGTVTSIASGTGLLGGPISSNGTLSVDVGTAANKILQLNASAQLPAVDGSLLTNVNAVSLQSRPLAATAPTGGQVIAWNASVSQWQPSSVTSGTVTTIASGTGLLGGPITSNGTLSVDVGTAPNKILQLNASAQIPAVDGSLLTSVNAVSIQSRSVAATAPTGGQVIAWNASASQWQPSSVTSGTVTNISSGTGLLGGPITSNGTLSVDTGTTANKILQLNASAQVPAVDGSLLLNVNATQLQSRSLASTAPTGGQVIAWNASASQWQPTSVTSGTVTNIASGTGLLGGPISSNGTLSVDVGTAANKIVQLNASAQVPAVDGSLLLNVNAMQLQTRSLAATAPTGGQVIAWNASQSQWQPSSVTSGTVTTIASGTGLLGGPISSNGTLNVDVGTAANKILQLNASAQIPAVDGSLLLNVNAMQLQSRSLAATAPTGGQVIAWNASQSQWQPSSVTSGTVTTIASGTGLLGGPISSNGTLSVDVGTAANKILQLNASAQVPAVDGFLLTNVNAVSIQSRAVAATAPTGGQVIAWNASASQWQPSSVTSGTVTTIASGSGLLGGPITTNGTLSVDTGTTANKILQLNASAQVPAVDGSLLTNVNAVSIQSRPLASTAPTAGQVIAWNATASQWQPSSATSGTVTNIASGTGLLGGPISSNGTLSVDVGTAANKILQLNASAQVPAVDGSLLLNVNATQLQSRSLAATAPTSGQVIAWNASQSQWQPSSVTSGTVTTIASGSGLLGGPITSNGTLSVDTGTTANKILQLNASAQVPAVDGSLLTNVNAVSIQTRAVASTAPTAGQVIAWNATASQWQPSSVTSGTVTNVASGVGLLGGPISSNGTLSVDVGTAANKILQLNASAQIPAVDGSLLTNVNATLLQSRALAATAPTAGQVIAWNATQSQWQPSTVAAGGVTNIATGTGLTGGPITATGTIAVNVGINANQIPQLNGSAQLALGSGSAGAPTYAFQGATDTGVYSPGAGSLALTAGGSEYMRLSGGYVGIGTTSMDHYLDVWANNSGLYIAAFTDTQATAQDVGATIQLKGLDGSSDRTFAMIKGGKQNGTSGNYDGYFSVSTRTYANNTLNEKMRVTAQGALGLGTTAPAALLDVYGTGAQSAIVVPRDTTANRPSGLNGMLRYNTTTAAFEGYANGAWGSLGGTGSVTSVATDSTLTGGPITTAGTLGVAVGSAAGKIVQENSNAQIAQTIGSAALPSFSFAGNVNTGLYSPGTNQLALSANGVAALSVTAVGNVGIGTTAPQGVLDLFATGTSSAFVVPRDTTANRPTGVNGMIRYNTTTAAFEAYQAGAWTNLISTGSSSLSFPLIASPGTTTAAAPSYSFQGSTKTGFYSSGANQVAVAINGTAAINVAASTRVGIGSATPAAQLDIATTSTSMGLQVYAPGTTSSGALYVNATGSNGNGIVAQDDNGNVWAIWGQTASTTAGAAGVYGGSYGSSGVVTGVGGEANSPNGRGGAFVNNASTGSGIGVYASVNSASGYALYANSGLNFFNGKTGIFTGTPQGALDVAGTGTAASAMLVPRDTTANRPTGVNAMIRYNTTTNAFEGYANGNWGSLVAGAPAVYGAPAGSNTGVSIDFSTGNKQYTSASCGAFTLNNLKDGGDFTLAVQGSTSATCTFTAYSGSGTTGPLTVHLPPDNGNTTSGKHTLFNFSVLGSNVYVSWMPGY